KKRGLIAPHAEQDQAEKHCRGRCNHGGDVAATLPDPPRTTAHLQSSPRLREGAVATSKTETGYDPASIPRPSAGLACPGPWRAAGRRPRRRGRQGGFSRGTLRMEDGDTTCVLVRAVTGHRMYPW